MVRLAPSTSVRPKYFFAAFSVRTTLSGWLTDRHDPRVLLFWYYGLRGFSLLALHSVLGAPSLGLPLLPERQCLRRVSFSTWSRRFAVVRRLGLCGQDDGERCSRL